MGNDKTEMNKSITYSGEGGEKQEGYWRKRTSPSILCCIVLTFKIMLMFYIFRIIKLHTKEWGEGPKSEYKQKQITLTRYKFNNTIHKSKGNKLIQATFDVYYIQYILYGCVCIKHTEKSMKTQCSKNYKAQRFL